MTTKRIKKTETARCSLTREGFEKKSPVLSRPFLKKEKTGSALLGPAWKGCLGAFEGAFFSALETFSFFSFNCHYIVINSYFKTDPLPATQRDEIFSYAPLISLNFSSAKSLSSTGLC